MIRGWRNDPQWCAFYKQRDEVRIKRQNARIKMESQLIQSKRDLERLTREPVPGMAWLA